jgi:hypothetical protein
MHPMSRHQDAALPTSLYTLPAIVLLVPVALLVVPARRHLCSAVSIGHGKVRQSESNVP